jgi:hypothetical protein
MVRKYGAVDTILPKMEPGNPGSSAWSTAEMCRTAPTTQVAQYG